MSRSNGGPVGIFPSKFDIGEGVRLLIILQKGALIVGDAIAGGGGPGEALVVDAKYTRPLPKAIGDHIAAMVLYGNPRHMPNQAYDIFNKNATGVSSPAVYRLLSPF